VGVGLGGTVGHSVGVGRLVEVGCGVGGGGVLVGGIGVAVGGKGVGVGVDFLAEQPASRANMQIIKNILRNIRTSLIGISWGRMPRVFCTRIRPYKILLRGR